jgi:hypothetical protein
VLVLLFFAIAAIVEAVSGKGFDVQPFDIGWFNPFAVSSFSRSPRACRCRSSSSGGGTSPSR